MLDSHRLANYNMCYHTTYLFSLCGHIAVSDQPVKHAKPCPKAKASTTIEFINVEQNSDGNQTTDVLAGQSSELQPQADDNDGHRLSHQASLLNPFPSPQEFEFAKELHSSVPGSPMTPIAADTPIHTRLINPYSSLTPALPSASVVSAAAADSRHTSCPISQRHPLQTYILPHLCSICQTTRVQNIARFEAQTIKESVDREHWGYNRGVVDPERKKINRRSAGRGKLIPLICVEEGRIRQREVRKSGLRELQGEVEAMKLGAEHGPGMGDEENMPQRSVVLDGSATPQLHEGGAQGFHEERRESHPRMVPVAASTTTASAPTATSGWSWWSRGSSTPAQASTSEATPGQQQHQKQLSVSSPRGSSPRVDWSAMQDRWSRINSNVSRDVFGRNAQGMNRIMGWGGGGNTVVLEGKVEGDHIA